MRLGRWAHRQLDPPLPPWHRPMMMQRVGGLAGVLVGWWLLGALSGCFGRAEVPFAQRGCTQEDVSYATPADGAGRPAHRGMASIPLVNIATLQSPTDLGKVVFLDGVVQERHGCAPNACPAGAACQPCAPYLIVADPPGVGDPRSLVLQTEAQSFMVGRTYRFLLVLSEGYRERLGALAMHGESPAVRVVCAGPR